MLTTTIIIIFNISNIITMLVYLVLVFYCYIKKKPLQKCVPEIKKEHLFTHDSAMWARQCFT